MARKSDQEIERGLLVVAELGGEYRKASEALKADGIGISAKTLEKWVNHIHTERYAEVRAQVLPQIREQAREKHEDLIERWMVSEQDCRAARERGRRDTRPRPCRRRPQRRYLCRHPRRQGERPIYR
jgi:hypothetical protein